MSLSSNQAKHYIGGFCTRITEYKGKYKVYFKIPNASKKTIARLLGKSESASSDGENTTGYVIVDTDPSALFDKQLFAIPVRKHAKEKVAAKKAEKVPEKPELSPVKTAKESEKPKKKAAKKETKKKKAAKKSTKPKKKKKKRGFFSFGDSGKDE